MIYIYKDITTYRYGERERKDSSYTRIPIHQCGGNEGSGKITIIIPH